MYLKLISHLTLNSNTYKYKVHISLRPPCNKLATQPIGYTSKWDRLRLILKRKTTDLKITLKNSKSWETTCVFDSFELKTSYGELTSSVDNIELVPHVAYLLCSFTVSNLPGFNDFSLHFYWGIYSLSYLWVYWEIMKEFSDLNITHTLPQRGSTHPAAMSLVKFCFSNVKQENKGINNISIRRPGKWDSAILTSRNKPTEINKCIKNTQGRHLTIHLFAVVIYM